MDSAGRLCKIIMVCIALILFRIALPAGHNWRMPDGKASHFSQLASLQLEPNTLCQYTPARHLNGQGCWAVKTELSGAIAACQRLQGKPVDGSGSAIDMAGIKETQPVRGSGHAGRRHRIGKALFKRSDAEL